MEFHIPRSVEELLHIQSIGRTRSIFGYEHQNQRTLEDRYVDGISITYGHPRNHIWTFAAGRIGGVQDCPCNGLNTPITVPPFIDEDYFCERGTDAAFNSDFIDGNPLWDGQGCTSPSTCCEFNNPPWFCQQLPEPTTEDIEIRIIGIAAGATGTENEDTPVELIKIFVQ